MLLLTACTNILIPDIQNYKSVHLNGNGWIQIPNQNYNCTNDLRVFDDNFTFEIYFSGDNKNTNSAGTIFSLTGKQTENFIDTNCNGVLDENEIDSNEDGTLDIEVDDEFVVLAVQNDPTENNLLSLYVNDIENEILFEGKNFNSEDEFHLLQITSNSDSIFFSAHSFRQAYITDFLNFLVYNNIAVNCLIIEGGWMEIDTPQDYNNAQKFYD